MGLPGRGRLPRAAGPAKRNGRQLILRRYADWPAFLRAEPDPVRVLRAGTWSGVSSAEVARHARGGPKAEPGTASMTMDLYGHLVDADLWHAARLVGDI